MKDSFVWLQCVRLQPSGEVYGRNNRQLGSQQALELFEEMQRPGLEPLHTPHTGDFRRVL